VGEAVGVGDGRAVVVGQGVLVSVGVIDGVGVRVGGGVADIVGVQVGGMVAVGVTTSVASGTGVGVAADWFNERMITKPTKHKKITSASAKALTISHCFLDKRSSST
jgi:hypothetical protein